MYYYGTYGKVSWIKVEMSLFVQLSYSMGAMEGLSYNETVERLKKLYWPTLKACWIIWPILMVSMVLT